MKIVILGANGKVGSRVATLLIGQGHEVIAGVHKNSSAVPAGAVITPFDITKINSLTSLFSGADAVICTMSSWGSPNHNVLSTAMKTVIPAMNNAGIKRIVSISGDIALLPNERPSLFVRLTRLVLFGTPSKVVSDSEDHLRQLYDSDLDWTVVRPTIMSSSSNSEYQMQQNHPLHPLIARAAVAKSVADLATNPDRHLREAPFIHAR